MAKIQTTAIVADIRNKLNGSVFSKNRYGSYVRTKVTPVNPQTTAQQNVRNRLSTNSQAWRGLTEAQRQGWIDAAANFPFTDIFGNSRILSGNALYVKLNNNLAVANQSPIADAPLPVAIPALVMGTVASLQTGATLTAAFTDTPVPANFALIFQTTGNVGPGKSFVKNLFRQTQVVAAAGASPTNLATAFAAIHGTPVEGQKIFVRAFYISTVTGQAGIPVQGSVIVGA